MMSPAPMYSLARTDHLLEGLRRHVGLEFDVLAKIPASQQQRLDGLLEQCNHAVDLRRRLVVGPFEAALPLVAPGRGHDLDRVADVVEDDERVGDHEDGVVHPAFRMGALRQPLLEVADHVIAEETHGPAAEARKPAHGDGPVPGEKLLQDRQGIAPVGELHEVAVAADLHLLGLHADDGQGVGAQEGVTAPLLAALDALQQEGVGALPDLQEGRHRRLLVGEDLPVDGDEIAAFGKFLEFVKRGLVHDRSKKKRPCFYHGLFVITVQNKKSRGAPSGFPTALISQLMFLWQQANPSYEVAPPPVIFRKVFCSSLLLQLSVLLAGFPLPVNPVYSGCNICEFSLRLVKMPRCKAPESEDAGVFCVRRATRARETPQIAIFHQPARSIEEPRRHNPAPLIDVNPFLFQQRPFHGKAALVSAERPVGADRPVAGDDDGKGICRQGVAHGAGTPGRRPDGLRFSGTCSRSPAGCRIPPAGLSAETGDRDRAAHARGQNGHRPRRETPRSALPDRR